jgi:hypothetical protein
VKTGRNVFPRTVEVKTMTPDLDDLYIILRQWAIGSGPQTYTNLSHAYHARTGDWFEPHGSWDQPLGTLNNRLATVGAPALSALVILKEENEPGAKFWGCSPNVPARPQNDLARLTEWNRIVTAVRTYPWPEVLPR